MALTRLIIDGYASLELNRVAFPHTTKVVADLPLAAAFTAQAPAENGMILAVDYAKGEVRKPVTSSDAAAVFYALHASTEKEYDPNRGGLKGFSLAASITSKYQHNKQGFYPRLGVLEVGDRFTTNCLVYESSTIDNDAALKVLIDGADTTPLYGIPSNTGAIQLTATAGTGPLILRVIGATTMPNGDYGVKLVVVKAN